MLPTTFEEWYKCITQDCKINLTKDFAKKRLTVYHDLNNAETKKFISLYGEKHLENIINWLEKI